MKITELSSVVKKAKSPVGKTAGLMAIRHSLEENQVMRNDKENIIVDKTIEFSLAVITFCEVLESERKYIVARQLLRSATAIGANVNEAQNAESPADFIHKMKIAAKEASETRYWLTLCERSSNYHFDIALNLQIEVIIKILSKIISSSKGKRGGKA